MKFRSLSYLLGLVLSLGSIAPAAASELPEAVLEAMEVDMSLVVSGSISTPNTDPSMFDVRSSLGVISPYNAPEMGVLFTGDVDAITNYTDGPGDQQNTGDYDYPGLGDAGDHVTLEFEIEVPIYANSFSFNFNFLSREYPEWVTSVYNDTFEVFLTSSAYTGQIVFDAIGAPVTVNAAFFVVTDPILLEGTGFYADGATGWLTTIAPCTAGERMSLRFEIYDVSDGVWDSAVLLDNFAFSEQDVPDGPWTGDDTPNEPLQLAYVSPKQGDLDGGIEVTLNGKNFSHDTVVYWNNTLIDTADTVVGPGGDSLRIDGPSRGGAGIPPAPDLDNDGLPDEGNINIRVIRGADEATLEAAFTYWDFSSGAAPPRVVAVGPENPANPAGGALIRVRGSGFADGAQVLFIDAEQELPGENTAVLEGGQEVQVNVPAHAAGWVDLVVMNPDGLRSEPGYPFQYSSDAALAPTGAGAADDRDGGGCSVGGSVGEGLSFLALLLVGLLTIRMRKED